MKSEAQSGWQMKERKKDGRDVKRASAENGIVAQI